MVGFKSQNMQKLVLVSLVALWEPGTYAQIRSEVPSAEAVRAAAWYWEGFDAYENKMLKEGREKYHKSWLALKKSFDRERAELTAQQIETLKKAIAKYRENLHNHPDVSSTSYVMLNMAQLLNKLADHYEAGGKDTAANYRSQALDVLEELKKNDPGFAESEAVLYHIALTYENLGLKEKALAAWKNLARVAANSQYGLYALIAVGDSYFNTEESPKSLTAYRKARELLDHIKVDDKTYEKTRILFRLVWAGYRTGDLDTTVEAGIELLADGPVKKAKEQEEKIALDAIEVVGDALFEINNVPQIKQILGYKKLGPYAAAIGLRSMRNYLSRDVHADVIEVGEFLVRTFPTSRELPDILTIMGKSYHSVGNTAKYLAVGESLALLLPERSLWRNRNVNDYDAIKAMETKAVDACKMLAAHYYEHGMKAANPVSFKSAITYFDLLIRNFPNDPQAAEWRLRMAHSYYFAEDFLTAEAMYDQLKKQYKLSLANLKVASYQLTLTREKLWRQSFYAKANNGKNPHHDEAVLENLKKFEGSVEEYVNQFPYDRTVDGDSYNRSVDLLLVAAGAFRDHEQYEKAASYWQRALVSHPTAAQRSSAIRGLILASLARKNTEEVIKLTQNFLKLEDLRSLGSSLDNELNGVLSTAAREYGGQLTEKGDALEAGKLMVGIAKENTKLPERDKLYRDGAYLLAIGGDWSSAQLATEGYLAAGLTRYADDMTYLRARCQEYQMRFAESSKTYLRMAQVYPAHSRATVALASAEKLAAAEEDWTTAANAAALQGDRAKNKEEKQRHYRRAIDYAQKGKDLESALKNAEKLAGTAPDRDKKIEARLASAKITYSKGEEGKALAEYQEIAATAAKQRRVLERQTWSAVYGEANFLLGEEARAKFSDYVIRTREGSIDDRIVRKMSYFNEVSQYYGEAIKSEHTEWMPRGNYMMGTTATALADEMNALATDLERDNKTAAAEKLKGQARRLRKLAEEYHGKNILLKNKNPLYANNDWIKRSGTRLWGKADTEGKTDDLSSLQEDIGANMISHWSL
jgi:tetratricopeptide (TPR) repeat protein